LSDATVDNSCIYLIPQDRVFSAGLNDFLSRNHVTPNELGCLLWATKALPAAAGSLLGWNGEIVHWGSIARDSDHPRISVTFDFVSAGAEAGPDERLLDPICRFSFSQRIRLICEAISGYDHPIREPLNPIYRGLVERIKETVSF
jgi:hypothetical protein